MGKKVICHNAEGEEKEVDSDELYFRPSIYGILIEGDKVLLSRQYNGYDWPGGGMDKHETIEEALKREYWEEAGLEVKMGELVHCGSSFYERANGEYINSLVVYYLVEKIGGEIGVKAADELEKEYIGEPEWVEINKIKDAKFYNPVDNVELVKKALELLNK